MAEPTPPAASPAESPANKANDMFAAIKDADIDKFKKTLAEGADVNSKNAEGKTAIQQVIDSKLAPATKASLLTELLNRGADVNKAINDVTPLLIYALQSDIPTSKALLSAILNNQVAHVDLNQKDKDGNTALHIAVKKQLLYPLCDLIAKGADITLKNADNLTPLQLAEQENHHPGLTQMLREATTELQKRTNGAGATLRVFLEQFDKNKDQQYEITETTTGSRSIYSKSNKEKLIRILDINHDGHLDKAEIEAALTASRIPSKDINGRALESYQDLKHTLELASNATAESSKAQQGDAPKTKDEIIKQTLAMDKDGDGIITKDEAFKTIKDFEKYDLNKDGVLDDSEKKKGGGNLRAAIQDINKTLNLAGVTWDGKNHNNADAAILPKELVAMQQKEKEQGGRTT